ncbi:MAG: hypothetical protein J2P17_22265 [Mycobacterium sp.]|nr:hypothetical protein [Mycobacterium sp.]
MQWGTVPAWVAAGLSLVFGILSWRSSRKSRAERDDATRQAERAERFANSAERQAAAVERFAAAAEAQQRREIEEAEEAEADPWQLEPIPGASGCYLINMAKTTMYDITVSGLKIHDSPARFDRIGPGQREELSIMRFGHPDDSVEVTWRRRQDLSDSPQTMRKSIPSRI